MVPELLDAIEVRLEELVEDEPGQKRVRPGLVLHTRAGQAKLAVQLGFAHEPRTTSGKSSFAYVQLRTWGPIRSTLRSSASRLRPPWRLSQNFMRYLMS